VPLHSSKLEYLTASNLSYGFSVQIILYDTPGVIQKEMHKLDNMMMNNVKKAAIDTDCVLIVVDACHVPQKVSLMCLYLLCVCVCFGAGGPRGVI
jgi:GTPase Era involved in 16S rRNA processing